MGIIREAANQLPDERETLQRAVGGDQTAWARLLAPHRNRLRRMVVLRLDERLRGRIDPSDVLQEAFLQVAQGLPKYLERPDQPVFYWLRWLTGMTLQLLHRRHLGVLARDAGREVQLLDRPWPEATSAARWLRSYWAVTPAPAWRRFAPSGKGGCKRPSTPWTRWIGRSWCCDISRN